MNMNTGLITALRWFAAAVLAWAAATKFLATPDNVFIFTELGMEPLGRVLIGVIELIAALLLIAKNMAATGALLGLGTMCGAVIAHVSILGMVVQQDNGLHVALLCAVATATAVVLIAQRRSLPLIGTTL